MQCCARELHQGTFEVDDQVEALMMLAKNPDLKIDTDRIGVFGWSYGEAASFFW